MDTRTTKWTVRIGRSFRIGDALVTPRKEGGKLVLEITRPAGWAVFGEKKETIAESRDCDITSA